MMKMTCQVVKILFAVAAMWVVGGTLSAGEPKGKVMAGNRKKEIADLFARGYLINASEKAINKKDWDKANPWRRVTVTELEGEDVSDCSCRATLEWVACECADKLVDLTEEGLMVGPLDPYHQEDKGRALHSSSCTYGLNVEAVVMFQSDNANQGVTLRAYTDFPDFVGTMEHNNYYR